MWFQGGPESAGNPMGTRWNPLEIRWVPAGPTLMEILGNPSILEYSIDGGFRGDRAPPESDAGIRWPESWKSHRILEYSIDGGFKRDRTPPESDAIRWRPGGDPAARHSWKS